MMKAPAHFDIHIIVNCPYCQDINELDYDSLIDKYKSDIVTLPYPKLQETVICDGCGQEFEVEEVN